MSKKVRLIEPNSNECLYEFESLEKAYEKAKEMEALGIEVKIESPSAPESLAQLLGADKEDLEILKTIIDSEIESHQTCCPDDQEFK